jgi:CDP-diacylglycerol--serine O-phosphatidyltransferase
VRKGIFLLPSTITLGGMFAGFFSIVSVLKGNFPTASWAIIVAGLFDTMDGWVARHTNTTTRFGIELDSLSDVIAFGAAPAILLYNWALAPFGRVGWGVAFLFVACGALRLARYNIQMGSAEKKSFTGMPIPAAAAVAAAMVVFYGKMGWNAHKSAFVLIVAILVSLLMVSTLRFHSFKEINIRERRPFWILVGIVVAIAVFVTHPEATLFVFTMLYLAVGIAENAWGFLTRKKEKAEGK